MSDTLREALRAASVEDIVDALLGLNGDRPGLGYDVAVLLQERDASKEFPGAGPDWYPTGDPTGYHAFIVGYDRTQHMETLSVLRDLTKKNIHEVVDMLKRVDAGELVPVRMYVTKDEAVQVRDMLVAVGAKFYVDCEFDQPASHVRKLSHLHQGPRG